MDDDDDCLKPWSGYLFALGFILLVAGAVIFGFGFQDPSCVKNYKDCDIAVQQKCPCTIDQPSVDHLFELRVSGAICLALGLIITSIDFILCYVKAPKCCRIGSSSSLNEGTSSLSRQQQRNNDGRRFSTNTTQATSNYTHSQLLLDAATRRTTAYGISTVIPPSASTVNLPPSAPIDPVVPSAPITTIPTALQPPLSSNTRRPVGYRRPPPPVRRATRDQNWTALQSPLSSNTRRPGGYRRPLPPGRRASRDQNWTGMYVKIIFFFEEGQLLSNKFIFYRLPFEN